MCEFCTSFTDEADLRWHLIGQITNSGLKIKTLCFSSKRYERTASSCETSPSSTFEDRLDELDAIDLLWKLTSLSISSSSSSSSCPLSYSSIKTKIKTQRWLRIVQGQFNDLFPKLLAMFFLHHLRIQPWYRTAPRTHRIPPSGGCIAQVEVW